MLLLGFLLLPVALTMGRHVHNEDYNLTIHDYDLMDVREIGKPLVNLTLSNLDLEVVEPNAFAHLRNLKTLNLSYNYLNTLPKFIFANLTNLEELNLTNNFIDSGGFYDGLSSLKTLDISDNRIRVFKPGHFFGLTKFVKILTQRLPLNVIYAAMFENIATLSSRPTERPKRRASVISENIHLATNNHIVVRRRVPISVDGYKFKVCIHDNHLKSLEMWRRREILAEGCHQINIPHSGYVSLGGFGIKTFESGWYRLRNHAINYLSLDNNEITQFTKQLLNDLPHKVETVSLRGNKIKLLKRGEIENKNPFPHLSLANNVISEIEDGALEKLNLTGVLDLDGNRLKDTKFLDSLPSNIVSVEMSDNKISEISTGNFSKFTTFSQLGLSYNSITEIKAPWLRGFSSLRYLNLDGNRIRKIELGSFQGLKNLSALSLSWNRISSLEKGVFLNLENIASINLRGNRLTEITSGVFSEHLNSLEDLTLASNSITTLKAGTFSIPHLKVLNLDSNSLTELNGDMFEGLGKLEILNLESNNITMINKGAAKNLNALLELNLSENPIKKLVNGALFGLLRDVITRIVVRKVPLEIVEGGLFDHV